MHTRVRRFGEGQGYIRKFRSGISLHIHTHHSRENLEFVKRICEHSGLLRKLVKDKTSEAARNGIKLDFSKAYWRPPLSAEAVFSAEKKQIESLGLRAMVSVTDHDCIDGAMRLNIVPENRLVTPVSVEWTLPFRRSVFHLGIHNLPVAQAHEFLEELLACKAEPSEERALDLLQTLQANPSTLVVLNHPLWNLRPIPRSVFENDLDRFLGCCGSYIHAMEVNGLRSWDENVQVMALADRWERPVVSGGDRHGCEPNANLNLTNAASFAEWAQEIREGKSSDVLFMPQFEESRALRLYRVFVDAVREYPEHSEGERCWYNRTFHPDPIGVHRPLASLWRKTPVFLEAILGLAAFAEGSLLLETIASMGKRSGSKVIAMAGQERAS